MAEPSFSAFPEFKNSLRGSEKLKDNPSSNVQQVSGDLWNLDRLDSRERNFDGVYSYTNTGKGVNAYVLDTGVRHTHSKNQRFVTVVCIG